MAYQVGIDLGTTATVAAVCRPDGSAHVVPLDGPAGTVASVVHVGADGALLVGEAAARRALTDPDRVVRELVRRIGDGTPLLVGRTPVVAAELAARFLARLVADVARREGGVASRVAVTHPGSWGPHRVGALRTALAEHGLGSADLVPEPVAAAAGLASPVGVYDLGAGRFEAAVVRGRSLVGPAVELDRVGGADLDEAVFTHVRAALGVAWEALDPADPEVLAAVADLRRECTAAKEALSRDTEVHVPVVLPGLRQQVRLGRAEFEEMIRPVVDETVEATRRAFDAAGLSAADLATVLLVGGSAQVPLVPQVLGEELGRAVTVAPDPVGAVAVGAARLAREAEVGRRPGPGRTGLPAAGAVPGLGAAPVPAGRPAGGPGTLPFAAAAAPGPASADGTPGGPATVSAGEPSGTHVLPVARPPKQARPFTVVAATPTSRPRRIALLASAGAVVLAVVGGVAVFGVERIGASREADAVTPAAVVDPATSAGPTAPAVAPPAVPPTTVPAPGTTPPARRPRPVAPPAAAPPAAPSTTPAPEATSAAPEPPGGTDATAPEQPPATEAGTGGQGNGGGGAGNGQNRPGNGGGKNEGGKGGGQAGGTVPAADASPADGGATGGGVEVGAADENVASGAGAGTAGAGGARPQAAPAP